MTRHATLGRALTATAVLIAFTATAALAAAGEPAKDGKPAQKIPDEATCPVTGEKFKPTKDTATAEYKGTTYYFCCAGCKPQFIADPEKYVKEAKKDDGKGEKKEEKHHH